MRVGENGRGALILGSYPLHDAEAWRSDRICRLQSHAEIHNPKEGVESFHRPFDSWLAWRHGHDKWRSETTVEKMGSSGRYLVGWEQAYERLPASTIDSQDLDAAPRRNFLEVVIRHRLGSQKDGCEIRVYPPQITHLRIPTMLLLPVLIFRIIQKDDPSLVRASTTLCAMEIFLVDGRGYGWYGVPTVS